MAPLCSSTLVSLLPAIVAATSYYISPSGADSNSGTSPASPWQSTAPANSATLSPGDAILFQGGVDHSFTAGLVISFGGLPSAPVLVSSYGSQAPARIHVDGSITAAVTIYNTGGVEVANISVIGTTTPTWASKYAGIVLYVDKSLSGPPFDYVYVHDVTSSGFHDGVIMGATGCQGFTNVLFERVVVTGNSMTGLSSYSNTAVPCLAHSNIVVQDSTAYNNSGDPTYTSNWSGSGIVLGSVDGALITRCVAHDNGYLNAHNGGGPVGIWAWNSNNVTISHCVSYHNQNGPQHSDDGGGFDLDGGCTNSVVEYCLSFENQGPGFLICQFSGSLLPTSNNTVRYSVSFHDGLQCANGATGLDFYTPNTMPSSWAYGNTWLSNVSDGHTAVVRSISSGLTPTLISGNVLITAGAAPLIGFDSAAQAAGVNFSGNAYWSTADSPSYEWLGQSYTSLAAWRAASGEEETASGAATGTDADPGLNVTSSFFQTCVQWDAAYPAVPNSPMLDAVRGFAGC